MNQDNLTAFSDKDFRVTREGRILHVLLNRPHVRNALSADMFEGLEKLIRFLEDRNDIHVVVIRGAGGNFCSGADLKAFNKNHAGVSTPPAVDDVAQSNRRFGRTLETFSRLPQVLVCVVEGIAFAGGFGLAAAADIVVADQSSRFSISEPRVGVVPAQILPFVLRRVGESHTKRIAFTGIPVEGEELRGMGLANFMANAGQSIDEVLDQVLGGLLKGGPEALRRSKRIIDLSYGTHLSALLDEAARQFAESFLGEEAREGIRAFVEKRSPSWS